MALAGARAGSLLLLTDLVAIGAVVAWCVSSWPVVTVDDGCWC